MSFDKQVSEICKASYFHIRALRHIRSSFTTEACKTIATAIVGSRLDYCNSLLVGTSTSNLARLQLVQNTLARVVTQKSRFSHISPVFSDLHWLPIRHRISFKLATITFKVLQFHQPSYLAALIPRYTPLRSLRSSSSLTICVPSRKTILWQSRNPFHPLLLIFGINCLFIFHPFLLFLLSGRDSNITCFWMHSPVLPHHPVMAHQQRRHLGGGAGGPSPPKEKEKRKKRKKKKKEKEKRKKREKRKKGTMKGVKLLHIKCFFFQFFNSPVALKN